MFERNRCYLCRFVWTSLPLCDNGSKRVGRSAHSSEGGGRLLVSLETRNPSSFAMRGGQLRLPDVEGKSPAAGNLLAPHPDRATPAGPQSSRPSRNDMHAGACRDACTSRVSHADLTHSGYSQVGNSRDCNHVPQKERGILHWPCNRVGMSPEKIMEPMVVRCDILSRRRRVFSFIASRVMYG